MFCQMLSCERQTWQSEHSTLNLELFILIESNFYIKPTFTHMVPPLVSLCTHDPRFQRKHLESLKYIGVGAAPLGESTYKQFTSKSPTTQLIEGMKISSRNIFASWNSFIEFMKFQASGWVRLRALQQCLCMIKSWAPVAFFPQTQRLKLLILSLGYP